MNWVYVTCGAEITFKLVVVASEVQGVRDSCGLSSYLRGVITVAIRLGEVCPVMLWPTLL